MSRAKKNIVFFHPDLGIGGAERLVVDAAVGLQQLGHKVTIFTSHCDPAHCFEEARDGTLDVRVRGNTLVPPSILNRFLILCAILRQLHLVLQVCLFSSELHELTPNTFFIDQLSACVPLLRLAFPDVPVLFYCHFPDKLLAYRQGLVKKLYRIPFDWLESWTTGCSNVIVVNSQFTRGVFGEAFPRLRHRQPEVVYPCVKVEESEPDTAKSEQDGRRQVLWQGKKVLLSINRFERKKDVGLAVKAFARLHAQTRRKARLVIAGGYDIRVAENVSYHLELTQMAESFGLKTATSKNLVTALQVPDDIDVLFLLSVPSSLKSTLLAAASVLLYTPKFEHFGIVPLEGMLARVPVLAATTGGPKETVVDGETGWLRSVDDVEAWATVLEEVLEGTDDQQAREMGERGRRRVLEQFSQASMAGRLNAVMRDSRSQKVKNSLTPQRLIVAGTCMLALASAIVYQCLQ